MKYYIFLFCFYLSPLFSQSDGIITLPTPTGPYCVGTKAISFKDEDRTMPNTSASREWLVQAFYPAICSGTSSSSYPYMPGTLKDGIIDNNIVMAHAKPNAEMSPPKEQEDFPTLFFIPGLGQTRQSYTIICEELASHGYVILSLDQPYNSNFVKFPDGTTITPTLWDTIKIPRDRDYRYAYYDRMMVQAMGDIDYLLDKLIPLKTIHLPHLSTKKIGVMGHSFGGNVAHSIGFQNKEINVILDIDSKITDRPINGKKGIPENRYSKPVLFIRGSQYQENVGNYLSNVTNANIKKYSVEHSAFRDICYLAKKIPDLTNESIVKKIGKFLFKTAPQWDVVDTSIAGENTAVENWFQKLNSDIRVWLDQNLKYKAD